MIANQMGQPPTKGDCKVFRAQQGLGARILYDPVGTTKVFGSKETFMVLNEKSTIKFKVKGLDPGLGTTTIENAVIKELKEGGSVN